MAEMGYSVSPFLMGTKAVTVQLTASRIGPGVVAGCHVMQRAWSESIGTASHRHLAVMQHVHNTLRVAHTLRSIEQGGVHIQGPYGCKEGFQCACEFSWDSLERNIVLRVFALLLFAISYPRLPW